MKSVVNERLIREAAPHDDWYLRIREHYEKLQEVGKNDEKQKEIIKEDLYNLFESLMADGTLRLGGAAPELDRERKPIDTVVIHHTSQKPGQHLSRLNAIQLLNIYMPYYQDPTMESEKHLKGKPITSNHLRENRPVFWGYHWLLRMDGRAEQILPNEALGWHAANWDINCRSVGICLDNDYEQQDPGPDIIEKLGQLITTEYPEVSAQRIFGHKEVSDKGTVCPGSNFLAWKQQIVDLIKARDSL